MANKLSQVSTSYTLALVVEVPVDFILNGLRTNQLICLVSYPVLYLHDGSALKAATWSVYSSVFVDYENVIKWNLKNVCTLTNF